MKRLLAITAVLVLVSGVISATEEKESEVNFPDQSLKQSDRLMVCLTNLCRQKCFEEQQLSGICQDGKCICI
ncbi:unnamed protein product [Callosobruchus maculatus]|uniref:Invertebrate defensins family profile domain-containing protein n=1 Tax=Callosobruchus maculatus TaxID=64391 RepID=A0A653C1F4_CALMS|nr:unnamed protein product [Callosobruchus maculatus]